MSMTGLRLQSLTGFKMRFSITAHTAVLTVLALLTISYKMRDVMMCKWRLTLNWIEYKSQGNK